MLNDFKGKDIGMLKLCFLLYADEIVIIAETEEELNKGLSLIKK